MVIAVGKDVTGTWKAVFMNRFVSFAAFSVLSIYSSYFFNIFLSIIHGVREASCSIYRFYVFSP